MVTSRVLPAGHLVVTDTWVLLSRPLTQLLARRPPRLQGKLRRLRLPLGQQAFVTAPSDQPVEYEQLVSGAIQPRRHWGGPR